MTTESTERELDIVIWGATGFTGEIAVAYLKGDQSKIGSFELAGFAPSNLRWAICGRNLEKLEALKAGVEIIVCDSEDTEKIDSFVKRARVVIGMAGPFFRYSDKVVRSCAKNGTHWCDISGEVPWMRALIDRYEEDALASGAVIINQCGYDSIPSDIGTYLAVKELQKKIKGNQESESLIRRVTCYQMGLEGIGGGSLQTMMDYSPIPEEIAGNFDPTDPFLLGGEPEGGIREEDQPAQDASFDNDLEAWIAPFSMAEVNRRIVHRSNMQLSYGPRFNYQEFEICHGERDARKLAERISKTASPGFFQSLIEEGKLPRPGQGPALEERSLRRFLSVIIAESEAGEKTALTLSGGDAAFEETARMVVNAGIALALDLGRENKDSLRGGFYTPAAGLGHSLVSRLAWAGLEIDIFSGEKGSETSWVREKIADFKLVDK